MGGCALWGHTGDEAGCLCSWQRDRFKESGVDARTESKINESSGLAGDGGSGGGSGYGGWWSRHSLAIFLVASKILFSETSLTDML